MVSEAPLVSETLHGFFMSFRTDVLTVSQLTEKLTAFNQLWWWQRWNCKEVVSYVIDLVHISCSETTCLQQLELIKLEKYSKNDLV